MGYAANGGLRSLMTERVSGLAHLRAPTGPKMEESANIDYARVRPTILRSRSRPGGVGLERLLLQRL